MKYFRHPLLALWTVITVALVAALVVIAQTPPVKTRPVVLTSAAAAATTLSLDFAELSPAAMDGGQSWRNVTRTIAVTAASDAKNRDTASNVRSIFSSIATTAHSAISDKTVADRWSDDVSLSSELDRLIVISGPSPSPQPAS